MRKCLKMEPAKDRETQPETEDLRNMLMTFRISELQEVLCTCGRPRSGRKHELLARTLTLLRQSEGTSLRERVKKQNCGVVQSQVSYKIITNDCASEFTLFLCGCTS